MIVTEYFQKQIEEMNLLLGQKFTLMYLLNKKLMKVEVIVGEDITLEVNNFLGYSRRIIPGFE